MVDAVSWLPIGGPEAPGG